MQLGSLEKKHFTSSPVHSHNTSLIVYVYALNVQGLNWPFLVHHIYKTRRIPENAVFLEHQVNMKGKQLEPFISDKPYKNDSCYLSIYSNVKHVFLEKLCGEVILEKKKAKPKIISLKQGKLIPRPFSKIRHMFKWSYNQVSL